MIFGQQLRMLREQKGISLNKLAHLLDVSVGYLSNLEKGKTDTISLKLISKYEEIFNVSLLCNPFYVEQNTSNLRIQNISNKLQALTEQNSKELLLLLNLVEKGISYIEQQD